MATKKCKICGRQFKSNYQRASYCSDECRLVAHYKASAEWHRNNKGDKRHKWSLPSDSLCWNCAKATGSECPWVRSFKPVDGWKAEKSEQYADGYRVKECPLFKEG